MSEEQQTAETRTAEPRGRVTSPSVREGDKVGRFSILSELGAGGMGRVYEAYDPELDRRIALKLLHDSGEAGHRQRLVREAQALARLDHPNVVTVHDVGVHEGMVFVSMEFVCGGTLTDWSAKNPAGSKSRFEAAIGLLVDAGRGLVAAHEAGLVHRDVKPSNILIGEDGRARVADFGIARVVVSPPPRPKGSNRTASEEEMLLSLDDSGARSTQTGAFVGTPAYMAPEQFAGRSVGAAADQFSLCVTAWELLFGERPFSGGDSRQRLAAIRKGTLNRPEAVDVDPEIVALLGRGLRFRASARHRRLADLVEALDLRVTAVPGSRRRSPWRWGLALAGVAVLGAGAAYRMGRTQQLCTGAAAAFEEVWDDERRESLRAAVLGSGLEFAPGAWTRLEAGLDAYGEAWRGAHTEACEATRVRGEQPPERMQERLACLDDAKRSVHALVTMVSSGEASAIANDRELLEGLSKVEDCARVRGVPTLAELSMLDTAARAAAQRGAGQTRVALEIIEPIAEQVDGETSPIVAARVLLEYGRGLSEVSGRRGIGVLSEAYAVAHAAGLAPVAAETAREAARQRAVLGEADKVRNWLELAKSQGPATSAVEQFELLTLEGMLRTLEGDDEGATRAFERGVEVVKADAGLLPHALRILAEHLGDHATERAVEVGREALALYQGQYGADHPGVTIFEDALAGLLARAGKDQEANTLARRALARSTDVWGERHSATRRYLVRLADVRCSLFGDDDEGTRLAKEALRLHPEEEATPARHRALWVLEGCVRSHEPMFARDVSAKRLELSKALYGEGHFRTSHARAMHAADLLQTSDVVGARQQLSLATALTSDAPGWDADAAMHAHRVSAGVASHLGLHTTAVQHAEIALGTDNPGAVVPGTLRLTRSDLCSARRVVGELDMALADCLEALKVARKLDQRARLATLEYEAGGLLGELRRHEEARLHMDEAIRLSSEVSGPRSYCAALARLGLAIIEEELGRNTEAEKQFRASFEVFSVSKGARSLVLESGTGAARTAARLGRTVEALALLDQLERLAHQMIDHALVSETRGVVLHIEDPARGAREYARAIKVYRFMGDTDLVRRACEANPFGLPECEGPIEDPRAPRAGGSRASSVYTPVEDG